MPSRIPGPEMTHQYSHNSFGLMDSSKLISRHPLAVLILAPASELKTAPPLRSQRGCGQDRTVTEVEVEVEGGAEPPVPSTNCSLNSVRPSKASDFKPSDPQTR